jgi:hypothetical protein
VNELLKPATNWVHSVLRQWDRFWFSPQQPHTLALIRICGGAMLFYTHLVWSLNLVAFLGKDGWLPTRTVVLLNQISDNQGKIHAAYSWSYFYYIDSPALLWTVHIAALVVFALLTVGYQTRVMSILAFIITISYCHRLTGSLFGLDQINALIATYLMLGSSGAVYSVDRWLAQRRGNIVPPKPTIGTNIAIRLIQLHMCVIYLFGGIGKARGELWWDGSALWYAFAILEYQSLDMTWTVYFPSLIALFTHITLFWELSYAFLVWPKLTRPIMIGMAVFVHAGIGLALGMKTFGLVMIIANLAFIYPEYVEATIATLGRLFPRRQTIAPAAAPVSNSARSEQRRTLATTNSM